MALSDYMDCTKIYTDYGTIDPNAPAWDVQLKEAIESAGIPCPESFDLTGTRQKWGEPGKAGDNAYYLSIKQVGGSVQGIFGSFRHQDSAGRPLQQTFISVPNRRYTEDELIEQSEAFDVLQKANEEFVREENKSKLYAIKKIYENSSEVGVDLHRYNIDKQIKAGPRTRIDGAGNLIIPMIDRMGDIKNIQKIAKDGSKRFDGVGAAGLFYYIKGSDKDAPSFVVEGYATGMSVSMATGGNVFSAFTSSNLENLAQILKEQGIKDIIFIADNDSDGKGEKCARTAAALCDGKIVVMENLGKTGSDANDYMVENGTNKLRDFIRVSLEGSETIDDMLSPASLSQEYIDMIGAQRWLIKHMLEARTINVWAAPSNGGKSTITMNYICPRVLLENNDFRINYIDFDASATDYARMFKMQEDQKWHGRYKMLVPNSIGKDPGWIVEIFKKAVNSGKFIGNNLFILDTLKKFTDLMGKKNTADLFKLLKSLQGLGATIVTLGHTNKNLDANNQLVVEGVGDVRSDTDVMYIFNPKHDDENRMIDVHACNDAGKGAKKRGDTRDQYFRIDNNTKDRKVEHLDASPRSFTPTLKREKGEKLTPDEVMAAIRIVLGRKVSSTGNGLGFKELSDNVYDEISGAIGLSSIQKIIKNNSVERKDATTGSLYYQKVSGQNKHEFRFLTE